MLFSQCKKDNFKTLKMSLWVVTNRTTGKLASLTIVNKYNPVPARNLPPHLDSNACLRTCL